SACRITSWKRSSATSRFLPCVRSSETTMCRTPRSSSRRASLRSTRSRCRGPRDGEPSTSKRSSTRVSRLLTFWPPGPPDREKRKLISPPEIVQLEEIRTSSIIVCVTDPIVHHIDHVFVPYEEPEAPMLFFRDTLGL